MLPNATGIRLALHNFAPARALDSKLKLKGSVAKHVYKSYGARLSCASRPPSPKTVVKRNPSKFPINHMLKSVLNIIIDFSLPLFAWCKPSGNISRLASINIILMMLNLDKACSLTILFARLNYLNWPYKWIDKRLPHFTQYAVRFSLARLPSVSQVTQAM